MITPCLTEGLSTPDTFILILLNRLLDMLLLNLMFLGHVVHQFCSSVSNRAKKCWAVAFKIAAL